MLLISIAPIIPVLAAVGVVGGLTAAWWFVKRGKAEKLGPGEKPKELPPVPTPPLPEPPPGQEFVDALMGEYEDNAFHETQSGDSINRLVTRTLNKISPGRGNEPAMIAGLRRLINRSQWNRDLYGEPIEGDAYAFDGIAVNRVFLPKHEDASAVMRTGFLPQRNIDESGRRVGTGRKWGDLWVPALNETAVRNGVSDPEVLLAGPWDDGTPATEPPPDLYNSLRERAA